MVNEQIEEFVLGPSVQSAVDRPEEELIGCKRETASEKIGRTLFKWNSEQSLSRGCIVSPEFDWPRLVGIVGSSGILERDNEPAGWQVSNVGANQMFERIVITVLLRRPGASVHMLPESELDG